MSQGRDGLSPFPIDLPEDRSRVGERACRTLLQIATDRKGHDANERARAALELDRCFDPRVTRTMLDALLAEPVPGVAVGFASGVAHQPNGPRLALDRLRAGGLTTVQRSRLASGYIGPHSEDAVRLLLVSLRDPAPLVRGCAVASTIAVRDARLVRALERMEKWDQDPGVRRAAHDRMELRRRRLGRIKKG